MGNSIAVITTVPLAGIYKRDTFIGMKTAAASGVWYQIDGALVQKLILNIEF
jgi:hypothetical protein